MTPERVAGWIVVAILLVLFIVFMLAVIDRIEADPGLIVPVIGE